MKIKTDNIDREKQRLIRDQDSHDKIYIAELEKFPFAPGDSPGGHAAQHCQQEYAYYGIKKGVPECGHQIQLVKRFYIIIKIQAFRQGKRTVQIQFLFVLKE